MRRTVLISGIFFVAALIVLGLSSASFALTVNIPHMTSGASDWADYLQVDNNSLTNAEFTITLYNEGVVVYTSIHQVDRLSETVIELKTLSETATCGQITYTETNLYFRLAFENIGGGLAEFKLNDIANHSLGFYFSGFSDAVEWKGLALANLGSTEASVTLYALGSGSLLGTVTDTVGAYSRIIGLHTDWFPNVDIDEIAKIIVVSSNGSLCGIVKNGTLENSKLLFVAAEPVFDFNTNDITGTWIGTYYSPVYSTGSMTMDVTQSGSDISGTLDIPETGCGHVSTPFTGTISDGNVTFEITYSCDGHTFAVEFAGTTGVGNTIQGIYLEKFDGDAFDSGTFSFTKE